MISTVMSGHSVSRFRERGTQDRLGRMFDGGDTYGAGGFVAKFAQIGNALIEIVKHRCKRLHKSLAGLGRRYAAGRACKKTHPQTLLKPPSVMCARLRQLYSYGTL
jgi:hypothetical protein